MKNKRYKKGRFIRIGRLTGGFIGILVDVVMGYFLIGVAIGAAIGFAIGYLVEKKMNPNPIVIPMTPEEAKKQKILIVFIILFILYFLTSLFY